MQPSFLDSKNNSYLVNNVERNFQLITSIGYK